MKKVDIYIKDEGYASIRCISDDAKEWANDVGLSNVLIQHGKTFCGEQIWTPQNKKGIYHSAINSNQINKVIKYANNEGFTVESEF